MDDDQAVTVFPMPRANITQLVQQVKDKRYDPRSIHKTSLYSNGSSTQEDMGPVADERIFSGETVSNY